MKFPRTVVSDWAWAGGPARRLLLSLLVSLLVIAVPYVAGSPTSVPLVMLLIGFDLGAYFMDRVYADRLTRRAPITG